MACRLPRRGDGLMALSAVWSLSVDAVGAPGGLLAKWLWASFLDVRSCCPASEDRSLLASGALSRGERGKLDNPDRLIPSVIRCKCSAAVPAAPFSSTLQRSAPAVSTGGSAGGPGGTLMTSTASNMAP